MKELQSHPPPNSVRELETVCLARSVAAALSAESSLEAVTVDRSKQTISVATLGRSNDAEISSRVTRVIRALQEGEGARHCGLLSGHGQCETCSTPLPPELKDRLEIRREGDATTVSRVTCPTAPRFWRWRVIPWPRVVQRDVEFLEHAQETEDWKPQLLAAIACGLLGIAGYALGGQPLGRAAYALAYLAGGWFPAREVWARLRRGGIDVHFLMLAVAAGSAAIGAWGEGATLLFLFSLSGALEHFALGRTQREIQSLFHNAPKTATILDAGGRESEVPVDELQPGVRLLVKPGAQFPADAEVVRGTTAADESNLTGESTPVEKAVGDVVLAGTLNVWGVVEAVVIRPATESALNRIIHLIRDAQQQKAPAQRFTDRFGTYYTYAVLVLSVAMYFVWWLGYGFPAFTSANGTTAAFYRAMTLLVVASPCALVLSIPSAVLAAIAWGARHGVLFRGGAAVEKLAEVDVVALDKTGTLTTGDLRVETVESFPPGRERDVAVLAFSLERLSTHPLARAFTRFGKQQGLAELHFDHFESVAGLGLRGQRGSATTKLGRKEWVEDGLPKAAIEAVAPSPAGFSEIWVREGPLLGRILMRDNVRPHSRAVLESLRAEGLKIVVLTGDRQSAAEHLRRELGLEDLRAELKPEEKVSAIREFERNGQRVAMIGDGVNDAPSLAVAHVGIAMGARGSDAALEQADVVLMHDRLENFLAARRLSLRARRIIRQNLVVSLGTVLVLVGFALSGKIPLTVGVVGHEGSTVLVVMNSLRLLFGRPDRR